MTNQRLFVVQVVTATDEQWFAPGTDGPPVRTERSYGIKQMIFAAMDEDDAYRRVCEWLGNDAFADADHDGIGDLRRFSGIGIHQLEEIASLDEFPAVARESYGVALPNLELTAVDGNGVPIVREKDALEVFRMRRIIA